MKAVNHSQRTRDVVSGNTARSQKTYRAGKKKNSRLEVTQAHHNTPSGTQQTECSTSHSNQLSGVNASTPNAGHHSGRNSKRATTTMHETPVYIEPDTDADGVDEAIHLSDGSSNKYHVSLPDRETERDTEIDEKDLD